MTDFATIMRDLGLTPHAEQTTMVARLEEDAAKGAISIVEAPPATGKTHVLAWRALALAAKGERSIVAVPTLAILRQTEATLAAMADHLPKLAIAVIQGRQEYVSHDAAREWMAEMAPAATGAFDDWSSAQTERGWTRTSLDAHLLSCGFDIDLPYEVSLSARRDAGAEASYRTQFETEADVMLVTHAMLARDIAARAGRQGFFHIEGATEIEEANEERLLRETQDDRLLPEWRNLLVDEAHLLVGNFMLAMTSRLSFRRLLALLGEAAGQGVEMDEVKLAKLERVVAAMESSPPRDGRRRQRASMDVRLHRWAMALSEKLASTPGACDALDAKGASHLEHFRVATMLAQRQRRANSPNFAWSDVHSRLSLEVTPVAMARQMDFLWRTSRSAALLSATMLEDDVPDDTTHDAFANQLSLPADRVHAHAPFDTAWMREPVMLHMPDARTAETLSPKTRGWMDALTQMVGTAADTSNTGMLVLTTSNETTAELAARLETALGDRVMVSDVRGAQAAALRFADASRSGGRPVWVATGPAWTGLDLPDGTLDSLVVTRLPYGLTNPLLSEHVMSSVQSRASFRQIESDMLRMLKQGIGRLVRRCGIDETRHLWVVDGRVGPNKAGARAASLLAHYARRQTHTTRG